MCGAKHRRAGVISTEAFRIYDYRVHRLFAYVFMLQEKVDVTMANVVGYRINCKNAGNNSLCPDTEARGDLVPRRGGERVA